MTGVDTIVYTATRGSPSPATLLASTADEAETKAARERDYQIW